MNYWFVIHDLEAYRQHSDLIGCRVKEAGIRKPKFGPFAGIQKGDQIVYYATGDKVVVGIFDVISNIEYLPDDPYWKEIMVYRIRPSHMPPEGFYLNFKKLIHDPNILFDLFPNKKAWAVYLQGKTCRRLTRNDFELIRSFLSKPDYLIETKAVKVKETRWHRRVRGEGVITPEIPSTIHQRTINKWIEEQNTKFGMLHPMISTNVDINNILPESIRLEENKKQIDGLAILKIGELPIYKTVLEVHHKGVREDTVVRIAMILPFVDHVDIVGDIEDLLKIKELLYRIADSNVLKVRVAFHTFTEYLKLK